MGKGDRKHALVALLPYSKIIARPTFNFPNDSVKQAMIVGNSRLISVPKIADPRGNLSFVESSKHIPFDIKRVFYLYDVPGGEARAGHALKTCHQFIIAIAGAFDVVVDNGKDRRRQHLNRSYFGLYLPPLIWRELDNFSSGSVCLVLASEAYDEAGYLRSYNDFQEAVRTDR